MYLQNLKNPIKHLLELKKNGDLLLSIFLILCYMSKEGIFKTSRKVEKF